MKQKHYCGCCGRKADAGEWCKRCAKHIDPRKTFWDATYFAQHEVHCPYSAAETERKKDESRLLKQLEWEAGGGA